MRYCFVLLFVLFSNLTFAQSQNQVQIDSLLRALNNAKEDTNEVLLLVKIDSLYCTVNPDRGRFYGDQALDLAGKILDWDRGRGLTYMTNGLTYKYKAEYKRALPLLFTARTYFENIQDNFDLADCLKYIGVVYNDQHDYPTALDYYQKSLVLFQQIHNNVMIARVYGNICNLYESDKKYDSAIYYGRASLRIFEQEKDKRFWATGLGNIGIVFKSMKNYDSALYYEKMALKIFEQAGDKGGIAINLGNIGETYLESAKDSASAYYHDSTAATTHAKLTQAIDFFSRAITVSNDINQIENILYVQPELAEAYELNGDYKAADDVYKNYITINDSTKRNEDITALATIESKRDLELRQREIEVEQYKKRYELTILVASVIILLIIIGIVVNRFLAKAKENKILAKEKEIHLEKIEAQATVLSDIAYTQSHDVRGEVATILGLAQIFNFSDPADPTNKVVLEGIAEVTEKLDAIVKATIVQENDLSREDRISIVPNKNTLG